jgi:hypothetical protein
MDKHNLSSVISEAGRKLYAYILTRYLTMALRPKQRSCDPIHTETGIFLEEPIWPRFSCHYYREAQGSKCGLAPRQNMDHQNGNVLNSCLWKIAAPFQKSCSGAK